MPGGELDGKAVPGPDQRRVQAEHVDEPESGSPPFRAGWRGSEPGQRVGWSRAGVVDADQDPPGCGPDPRGHRGAAVPPGVADRLRNADHQILQGRVGELAGSDAGDRVPDLGGGRIGQLDGRGQPFERIGIGRQRLEIRRVLVPAAGLVLP